MTSETQSSQSLFDRIRQTIETGFRQRTDYTCGPASLSLVADALGVGQIDEAEWIHSRFSRWLNIAEFSTRGISLQELLTAAEMTFRDRASVSIHRAFPESLQEFTSEVEEAARGRCALILNFVQDHLTGEAGNWQGSPHFSPLAGYRPGTQEILIADVDREIPAPYWTRVDKAFEAMAVINPAFQLPRGWLTIRLRGQEWVGAVPKGKESSSQS